MPADGAVRDALTALYNLEILLRSPKVGTRLLSEVMPEVSEGLAALRRVMTVPLPEGTPPSFTAARTALAAFTESRLDELARANDQAFAGDFDPRNRLALEQVVARTKGDLEAAVELLDLSDRAARPVDAELSFDQLLDVATTDRARAKGEGVTVHVARRGEGPPPAGAVFPVEPRVFRHLVAHAIARVHAEGVVDVAVRGHAVAAGVVFEVGPASDEERTATPYAVRLVRRIAPTDAVVFASAERAKVTIAWDAAERRARVELATPRTS